jgi:hypothetical protein
LKRRSAVGENQKATVITRAGGLALSGLALTSVFPPLQHETSYRGVGGIFFALAEGPKVLVAQHIFPINAAACLTLIVVRRAFKLRKDGLIVCIIHPFTWDRSVNSVAEGSDLWL